MTLKEEKVKILSLIEELNSESELLTDDPDISAKINSVINQVQNELARIKKIPAKFEYDTTENKTLLFTDIPNNYQINKISTTKYKIEGNYEIIFDDDVEDIVTIYYYKYPTPIDILIIPNEKETEEEANERIDNEYIFELSLDVLEVLPYGVAADLLKNDMISNYGKYYYERYNELKQMLDSRNTSGVITIEGGLDF
jgi:hypothetical protein